MLQEVIFKLNEEEFGFDIMKVNEIIKMQDLTAMPDTSAHILGVTNIRGKVIPIISLKSILSMAEKEDDESTRIIVVTLDEKVYGFKVDEVSEIIRIEEDQVERQEELGTDTESSVISGIAKVGDRLIKLIDFEKVV